MTQEVGKEGSGDTIMELVAASERDGEQFFRQPDNGIKTDAVADPKIHVAGEVKIRDRLHSLHMLVEDSALAPKSADEYRRIKRPLLSNAFGKSSSLVEKGNLILVTSTIPGEGKTHTAINLALSIAHERDHTVLLVDCDVTCRGASRLLEISDYPGLVDVIESDSLTVGDAILRTDIPELCLIAAGQSHDYVTELLASHKMIDLVAELSERYNDRVIIFDGPPLLSTPQTQVLAGLVGQVVFVVEAGKTPQSLVEEALRLIPEEQATGLVMNKGEGISSRGSYYYGYYGSK
jgi:protein-tyrosine kinase